MAFGEMKKEASEAVSSARVKLERSIATSRDLKAGEIIKEKDLHMLSPGDGFKWTERENLVGKKLKLDVQKDEILYNNMIN
jgi:sialic acid synthase